MVQKGPFLFGQPFPGSEKGRLESEPWSCKKMQVINHQDYIQTQTFQNPTTQHKI